MRLYGQSARQSAEMAPASASAAGSTKVTAKVMVVVVAPTHQLTKSSTSSASVEHLPVR